MIGATNMYADNVIITLDQLGDETSAPQLHAACSTADVPSGVTPAPPATAHGAAGSTTAAAHAMQQAAPQQSEPIAEPLVVNILPHVVSGLVQLVQPQQPPAVHAEQEAQHMGACPAAPVDVIAPSPPVLSLLCSALQLLLPPVVQALGAGHATLKVLASLVDAASQLAAIVRAVALGHQQQQQQQPKDKPVEVTQVTATAGVQDDSPPSSPSTTSSLSLASQMYLGASGVRACHCLSEHADLSATWLHAQLAVMHVVREVGLPAPSSLQLWACLKV